MPTWTVFDRLLRQYRGLCVNNTGTKAQSKAHHAVPQHLLRRFADESGRLTVVRVSPERKVLRRQSVREVGTYRRLNSWQNKDGSYDDELETGPMARLDSVAAKALDDARDFAITHAAEHFRLLDRTADERVPLYLFAAGQMVRSPELRDKLDEQALPTLKKHILEGLEEAVRAGTARDEDVQPVRLAAKLEAGFLLTPGANRHQALLLALIETVTAAIGSRFIVAVRRLPGAMLVTGSEPVVLFESHRFERGQSCAQLFTNREDPVRLWDDRTAVLKHVDEILGRLAGLAVAIDPRTLLLMVNPDLAEASKLLWIADHVPPEALGGMVNLLVTAGSRWIAGHDGLDFMALLRSATEPRAPLNTPAQDER
jgi:hypothetical protein